MMRILGVDPGLQKTGWGIVEAEGASLKYIACGTIKTKASDPLSERLLTIDHGLSQVIVMHKPNSSAIEETFVNKNPASALKLGIARGAAFLPPARAGLHVAEYPANLVKKTIVGAGHASKDQIAMMVKTLLPLACPDSEDAADALAIAICHAQHAASHVKMGGVMSGAAR
jgi:crossover junction endodeoxyribonuclease RuvC